MSISNNSSLSSLNEDNGEVDIDNNSKSFLMQTDEFLKPPLGQLSTSGYSSSASEDNFQQNNNNNPLIQIPSKTLIEAQYIDAVQNCDDDVSDVLENSVKMRVLRTPSIVVSDYSDDILESLQQNAQVDNDILHFSNITLSDSSFSSANCSSCDEVDQDEHTSISHQKSNESKISSFFQPFDNDRFTWIQLAGHKNCFSSGLDPGTILKRTNDNEYHCFERIQQDVYLRNYVPEYKGRILIDNVSFIQMEDLLSDFENPCIMDCKIGIRTISEDDLVKAEERNQLRNDMYEKMLEIDPDSPTEKEHSNRAVTKSRYMLWRESISSTSTYGFRIEGMKQPTDVFSGRHFKLTKHFDELSNIFRSFLDGYDHAIEKYFNRLIDIKNALSLSPFFNQHEFIGSSLLFVHDRKKANIWLIDFAKTTLVPHSVRLTHDQPWVFGNHEDGYLIGLNNIIKIIQNILLKSF